MFNKAIMMKGAQFFQENFKLYNFIVSEVSSHSQTIYFVKQKKFDSRVSDEQIYLPILNTRLSSFL